MSGAMQPWKTRARREALNLNQFLRVEVHTVELPDGRIIDDWGWVVTPDYVNVVALTEEDAYLFFRQTKYAIDGLSLAPVGGFLDPGEDPLLGARRELLEETGYEAAEWLPLGRYRVDASRGVGTAHFFLARGARQVAQPCSDDLEEQALLLLSRAEVRAALAAGEFRVLPWAANVALALLHEEA